MRGLSLAAIAVISSSVGIGLARADHVGQPFHAAPARALSAHKISPAARHVPASDSSATWYIVQLKDAPAALYRGGVAGYAATSARMKGHRRLDAFAPETRAYVDYLGSRQSDMLARAQSALKRNVTPRFQYHYALNGMSLKLSSVEAITLAHLDGVASVEPVRYYRPDASVSIPASATNTFYSRSWVNAPTVWSVQTFNGTDNEGEGVVVADVDTGINSSNASFAASGALVLDGYTPSDPANLRFGVCDPSNTKQHALSTPLSCNNKLIGAYSYTNGSNDPDSPEDSDGHGSHTASTAAGNFVDAANIGNAPISGVAPHASIIAYDVCDPIDQCSEDDSVEAVDQAIQDQSILESSWGSSFKGMVLNYSIGGSDDAYDDPVEQAFLNAVEAGIYVSAAGGNGGPENAIENDPTDYPQYAVQHVGPWVATMAASTHNGISGNEVENFSGGSGAVPSGPLTGASGTAGYGPANIVYAGSYSGDDPAIGGAAPLSQEPYPASQGNAANAKQCLYPFNSGTFTGQIVICDRGTNPLADKAYNVEQGGAGGIVIVTTNSSSQTVEVETYVLPGTLLDTADGATLKTWLGSSNPAQAQLTGATLTSDDAQADEIAGFSSRGPTGTVYDNILKPDLTAPGVSVLAAISNPQYTSGCSPCTNQPETYGFDDGTSMATPHDTGAAALLMQAHPGWTPAEIKSALMLNAVTVASGASPGLIDQCASLDSGLNCVAGTGVPSPQVRGAGRIDIDAGNRTGLLLDENGADYTKANPDSGGDLTALNLPGLANAGCVTTCQWTRTFTSAFTSASATYSVSVSGLTSGLQVTVSPSSFALAPGATQQLTVSADSGGVKSGQWAYGEIDITTSDTGDGGAAIPAMHLPVAVESTAPSAHMSISQSGLSFSVAQGAKATQQFTISNDGQLTLNWKLASVAGTSTQSIVSQLAASSAAPLSTGTIWNQTGDGSSGFVSDFFTPDSHGVYSADTFPLPVKADISQIVAQGFAQDSSGAVTITGIVNWYIYADASGQPAGNPDDGKKDYVWHYSASAASAGVDVSNGVITLDLATAGQPDAAIDAGNYWLIVAPTFNNSVDISSNPTWFWFETTSTTGKAMVIDPGNLLGQGTTWQSADKSLAFTLSGTLNCTGGAIAGLSFSPASGNVRAGGNETVTATYTGGNQAAGTYTGGACVSGNASDNPQIVLPVTAAVTQGSSKGGGGDLDLLALLGLVCVVRRKRRS